MAESWRVVTICSIVPLAHSLIDELRELGHEPVALLAPRRGREHEPPPHPHPHRRDAPRRGSISCSPATSTRSSRSCGPTSPT